MFRIIQADTSKLLQRFIDFPHRLYRGDPNYVPLLNLVQKQLLSPAQNPFFRTAEAAYFLALDGNNEVVGRIAAIYNQAHLDLYHDDTGFFGFFDCVHDTQIAGALLEQAAGWLNAKGVKSMTGPENPGTNDSVGILTRGFDSPPVIMMPYNFPYYTHLLEQNGLTPVMRLYSYLLKTDNMPDALQSKAQALENRLAERGIRIRTINLKHFDREVPVLRQAYNAANAGNWGFLPLDEAGFYHMAKDLRQLVTDDYILIAEQDGNVIGYAVSIPDYNQVFKKIPRGRLFPFGWYTLLVGQKRIEAIRIMILGVLPAFRGRGIDWCFYARIAAHAARSGIKRGEACYVMESNTQMNNMMKALEAGNYTAAYGGKKNLPECKKSVFFGLKSVFEP